jgi:hypothetical protein
MTSLNAYVATAAARHLPQLAAVDEAVTEPSATAVSATLSGLGALNYPVGLDSTGRVADGYGVQDQPWDVMVNGSGKVVWSHDGWLAPSALVAAVAAHL